ncbi:50S ribosomal protein L4 [ANME-1 cluster archaeon ex4572_4]|nr:MAG: 50S ribosomal protein L4 [ANME-1 cluster archaeon ex4572_4]
MIKEAEGRVKVLDLSGKAVREVALPSVFSEEYRPDLIKRAVLAVQSHRFQPKGSDILAGKRTSAESWGVGRGVSRVARIKTGNRAARAPQTVGGRRAHPPKTEKVLKQKINKKERRRAVRSAVAATADSEIVRSRGHKFGEEVELPLVVEDSLAGLGKTAEVEDFLKSAGVWEDLLRAKERKVRAGRGKMRGRRYKRRKSVLIVVSGKEAVAEAEAEAAAGTVAEAKIKTGAKNLPGVEVARVAELNAELLAPGTHPGRLTIWTESALNFFSNNLFSKEKTLTKREGKREGKKWD